MLDNILIYERNNSNYENIIKSNIKDLEKDIELYIYPQSFKNKYIDNIDYLNLYNGKKISLYKKKEKTIEKYFTIKKNEITKKSFLFFNNTLQLNLKYDKYYIQENENFADLKNFDDNIQFEIPFNFNCKFFIFKNKNTFSEFLKMDGIKFLILHLNFYYQIINYFYKSEEKKIDNQFNKLIDSMYIFFIYFF